MLHKLLNRINMYRVAIYYLATLLIWAIALSFLGFLPYSALDIGASAVYLVLLCWLANVLFAKLLKIKANTESAFITALILALIVGPVDIGRGVLFLSFVAIIAIASKYIIAFKRVHIFNPAAFAVLASFFVLEQGASWWVAGKYMAPIVILGGLVVIEKLGHWRLAGSFLGTYFLLTAIFNFQNFSTFSDLLNFTWQLFLFSPILYFTAIMLPEPQTAPKTHKRRIIYGIFVAVILALGQNYISAPYTLEASLLIGNVFVWAIYRDKRYILEFIEKKEIAPGIYNFWFKPRKTLEFTPGQFFEWTVYHKNPDSRGIRRYFTIASFPGEKNVLISAKVPQQPSTFKNKLLNLEPGDSVSILGPQGDFVIQDASEDKKFAFIAGGIGITPFRSMVKDMEESNMSPDIGILYFADSEKEFVFEDTFKNAEISYNRSTRRVNAKLIKEIFPDYNERIFYVSGPDPMVRSTEKILTGIGVKDKNIKTDYFPGYEEI